MPLFFSLIAAALIVTAVSGGALTWDGAKYLFDALNNQAPTIQVWGPLLVGRYSAHLLQWPVVWASFVSDDLGLLRTLFGLSYAAIPVVALAACWYLLPAGDRGLFVWPALSIGLTTLPAQFFLVSENLMGVQLAWPIALAGLTQLPRTALRWALLIALLLFVFCLHPVASPIFATGAAIAFIVPVAFGASRRRMWPWAVVLALLSALQFLLTRDDPGYRAIGSGTFPRWVLAGLPLASLVCVWVAGLFMLCARHGRSRQWRPLRQALRSGGWLLVVAAGGCLAIWARDPRLWLGALEFRHWLLPMSLPFFAMAVLDHYLTTRERPANAGADPAGTAPDVPILRTVATMFLIVLVTQSTAWFNVTLRLENALRAAAGTCISRSSITWLDRTPLYHGATPALAVLLQGRRPAKLLLEDFACADLGRGVQLSEGFYLWVPDRGWFDLKPAIRAALAERP